MGEATDRKDEATPLDPEASARRRLLKGGTAGIVAAGVTTLGRKAWATTNVSAGASANSG